MEQENILLIGSKFRVKKPQARQKLEKVLRRTLKYKDDIKVAWSLEESTDEYAICQLAVINPEAIKSLKADFQEIVLAELDREEELQNGLFNTGRFVFPWE